MDTTARRGELVGEDGLGLIRGIIRMWLNRVGNRVEVQAQQRPVAIANREMLQLQAAPFEFVDDAKRFEHFQACGHG